MKTLNISEARKSLPSLVESVALTRAPVVLLRYGKPAAMLVPVETEQTQTNRYPLRGTPITVANDFDAPIENLWQACEENEEAAEYGLDKKQSHGRKKRGKKA